MTRSTARVSCPSIWASDSSGTDGLPRRSCASSRCAFSIARSPPFAATYMSVLLNDAQRAWERGDGVMRRENQINPLGKQAAIAGKSVAHIARQGRSTQRRAVPYPGAGQNKASFRTQRIDLQHDRGRAIRMVGGADVECLKCWDLCRAGRECKDSFGGIVDQWATAMKAQPFANRHARAQFRIEPDGRVLIAQRQGHGGGALVHWGQGRKGHAQWLQRAGPRHGVQSGTEGRLCSQYWIGESGREHASVLAADQSKEFNFSGGHPLGIEFTYSGKPGAEGCQHPLFKSGVMLLALNKRITHCYQARLGTIAAEHVAISDLACCKPHSSARYRRFAKVERRTITANSATYHHHAVFARAQILVWRQGTDGIEVICDLGRAARGQERHRFPTAAAHLGLIMWNLRRGICHG